MRGIQFSACWVAALCISASCHGAAIDTPFFRFTISPQNGACEIVDKQAQVTWRTDTNHVRFGWIRFNYHEQTLPVDLTRCEIESIGSSELIASFQPFSYRPLTKFHVSARTLPDQRTLEVSYEEDPELQLESVSLLDRVFTATASGKGYVVVPVREGLLVPADSKLTFTHRFDTYAYEGCHMAMLGVVEKGAAALLTWDDPYVAAELRSALEQPDESSLHRRLSGSLVLSRSARTFRVQFLGNGDYVTLAKAYRQVAKDKGWLVTWNQKLKGHPERVKLFGAANVKLWSALDRRMNEDSTQEESARVNWTFDEAAQVAEHLKRDLKLDRVLFTLGGWIHRGYDNQHPDILPTAPECGGDRAFADCARRVMNLGYLFCPHDNYQDIYRDSPSWDEKLVMKTDEHKLARGGRWAGGRAYLVCSQIELELAKRSQNLPAVRKLSTANAYFIDTTYAANLQECYDPTHPLTRGDDMKWKQALSDCAREIFGVFGSECGREWAIPHSDFFEGLTGVSGRSYDDAKLPEKLGATVVPLFDLVYRDCQSMYGKYGYDPKRAAEYVLHHIILARPLNYHSIPPHLYWKQATNQPSQMSRPAPDPAVFARGDNGWTAGLHPLDRFIKNTYELLSPLNELTAQMQMSRHEFLTPDRKVQRSTFGIGPNAVQVIVNLSGENYVPTSSSGTKVVLPPFGFLIESPTLAEFHALSWGAVDYDSPALFTLRSLDGRPLSRSHRVRVYHAFGSERIRICKNIHVVRTEQTLDPRKKSSELQ